MISDELVQHPIPPQRCTGELGGIRLVENGDRLIEVPGYSGLHVQPIYHLRRVPRAATTIRLRAAVVAALHRVRSALPDGVELLIWDGLRTLETQQAIVEQFRAELPDDGDREMIIEQYLATPPVSEQAFRAEPPPHSTGGAVDLTLCDAAGDPLDLGAEHDEFDARSWLAYFEQPGNATSMPDRERRDLRRLLYWAMTAEGFSPYAWEYWHYELGTLVAAEYHGDREAGYGAAVGWPVSLGKS